MERRGAPVLAFTRISRDSIRIRNHVYEPDIVVVLDPLLPKIVDVTQGLKPNRYIVLNNRKKPSEIKWANNYKTTTVDAWNISNKLNLKVAGFLVFNTPMLGAFARATKIVNISSIKSAILDYFGEKRGKTNVEAAEIAYDNTFL
jgi:pyruvate ferredoxin oxidoreductase gamma subunit